MKTVYSDKEITIERIDDFKPGTEYFIRIGKEHLLFAYKMGAGFTFMEMTPDFDKPLSLRIMKKIITLIETKIETEGV